MNYLETLDYLYHALPVYQHIGGAAYKADLINARKLEDYFGKSHRQFRSIHVGGTNGKGSVSHMLAAVLQSAGYKTGLYTSPHLLDFRERIRVDGKEIPEEYVIRFVEAHKNKFEEIGCSFFEMTVFMAFEWFSESRVDFAIIEVGLGGRLDTTNIITPEVSVITNIGMDHMHYLGNSLEKIAAEKAGIMKPQVPVVIGETQKDIRGIFENRAKELNCRLQFADREFQAEYAMKQPDSGIIWHFRTAQQPDPIQIRTDLGGDFQKKNIATIMAVISILQEEGTELSMEDVRKGLFRVRELTGFSGRWQIVDHNPLTICDIAHNREGIVTITKELELTAYKELHMILGFVKDKDISDLVKYLPEKARYYLCEPGVPRAMKLPDLETAFQSGKFNFNSYPEVTEAYMKARRQASENDLIFIGGSTFLVADFLRWKKNSNSF